MLCTISLSTFTLALMRWSVLFFIVLAGIGFFILPDYGVGWDEELQIEIGRVNYEYVTGKNENLLRYKDREYGVAFELPAYALQRMFKTKTQQFLFRHYLLHAIFLLALIFLYRCLLWLFHDDKRKQLWASLAVLFMVLSPRIYMDSFYNSKDLLLLSIGIIHFYTLLSAIRQPTYRHWFLHAFLSALLLDIRILGLMNVSLGVAWLIYQAIMIKGDAWRYVKLLGLYLLATAVMLILIWPFLWSNPWQHFVYTYQSMKHFRWEGAVLFQGQFYIPTEYIPSHYVLVWIGITTPILFLLLFGMGYLAILRRSFVVSFKDWMNHFPSLMLLLALAMVMGPLLAVMLFKSVLYDGWRQLYFIYPFLIIIAIYGWVSVMRSRRILLRIALIIAVFIQCAALLQFYIHYHPYQFVYFNEFVSHKKNDLLYNYERDYWGLSYRQALDEIVRIHAQRRDTIYVAIDNSPGEYNAHFINDRSHGPYIKTSLVQDNDQRAEYYITNYRWRKKVPANFPLKLWEQVVQGSPIMGVYAKPIKR